MRLEKLAATALALTLAGAGAQAAPWSLVSDEPGSVFLLDVATGALERCATRAAAGPKVLDVFGDAAEARPQTARAGRTTCVAVRAGEVDPRAHRLAAILRARTGTLADLYRPIVWMPRGMSGAAMGQY